MLPDYLFIKRLEVTMPLNSIKKEPVLFENSHEATAIFPAANSTVQDILEGLNLKPFKAVVLVIGAADNIDQAKVPKLTQLFSRGIARAAAEADAVILDGATNSGVAALMGDAVAARGYKSQLVGVAPAALIKLPGHTNKGVPLEPNHSHFVLPGGNDWGSETTTLFRLVNAVAGTKTEASATPSAMRKQSITGTESRLPAVAILAGGGNVSRIEVLNAVRQHLPLIIVDGSGGLADEIAAAWKHKPALPDDPLMAEIIAEGEIHLHNLNSAVKAIERLIIRELGVDKVLMQAWETFADYDYNSRLQQKQFERLQLTVILIGVISTALVLIEQVFGPRGGNHELLDAVVSTDAAGNKVSAEKDRWWIIRHLLILSPILLTILLTVSNRFKQGSKWLLLRAGAESIKREIYRYRTRAMDYKELPAQQLSKKIEDITRRTMRTEVNLSALVPYNKEKGFPPAYAAKSGDDGFSYLTPDRYVELRLGDQLSFYQSKAVKMARLLKWLYWLTFIVGGIGTYLAAVNQQVWIALTTSIVAAMGTYLGYRQTESTLMKYNQAATDLSNVKAWWNSLSADEQSQQENIDSLVLHTEQVLQSELDGWVQQMQNALAGLRKNQETALVEKEEQRSSEEPPAGAGKQQGAPEETAAGGPDEPGEATAPATDDLAGVTPDGTEETVTPVMDEAMPEEPEANGAGGEDDIPEASDNEGVAEFNPEDAGTEGLPGSDEKEPGDKAI